MTTSQQNGVDLPEKRQIRNAFWELYQEWPLNRITVKEVCAGAGCSMTTFYRHYTDISEILEEFEVLCIPADAQDPRTEEALVKRRGTLGVVYPCTADEALYYALGGLIEIVALYKEEYSFDGYIRAQLDCEAGRASISIVRDNVPNISRHTGWDSEKVILSCRLSVHILALPADVVPVEDLIAFILE